MATNTKISTNGKTYEYYRITRTIGHKYKDGKKIPIKKQFTGSSKAAAERKYQSWLEEQYKNSASVADSITSFTELADYYVENILRVNSHYSVGTRELYERAYITHVKDSNISHKRMSTLKPEDIQTLYNSLKISTAALNSVHKFVKGFITWANRNKYSDCSMNAVILPEKPVVKKQTDIVTWSDSEIENIMNCEPDFVLKPLIVFALYSGMRISELLGLRWSDLDENIIHVRRQFYRGSFVLPKMGKERDIPMHEKIKDYVHTADRPYELVFCTASGNPLDYHNVVRSLDRFYRRNNIEHKKFHAYRATFVTRLCKNGVPIQIASKLAGHENITVTAKYYTSIEQDSMLDAIGRI